MLENMFSSEEEKIALLTQLNLLGVKEVEVEFSGGGDSGQIDSVMYSDTHGDWHQIPNDLISWTKQAYGEQEAKPERMTLNDVLEDLCYRALDKCGLDWYNNDGGQGNLVIDFNETPPEIKLNVSINYTSTEDHEFVIQGEEEE